MEKTFSDLFKRQEFRSPTPGVNRELSPRYQVPEQPADFHGHDEKKAAGVLILFMHFFIFFFFWQFGDDLFYNGIKGLAQLSVGFIFDRFYIRFFHAVIVSDAKTTIITILGKLRYQMPISHQE